MSSSVDPTASTTSAEDLLIPILIASNPGMKLDYKTMSALDGTKTASAFEHRFRKYKARAQEIIATKGGDAKVGTIPGGLVPVTPTKKRVRVRKSTGDDVNEDELDGEKTPKKKASGLKGSKVSTTPDTPMPASSPTTPKAPETPTTPKAPKSPAATKSAKPGKANNTKVKKETKPETDKVDRSNGETIDAAKTTEMAIAGEELLQEMKFEFDGGSQVKNEEFI